MEFNSTIFIEALNKALVGTDVGYANLNFKMSTRKVLEGFVKKMGFDPDDFRLKDWSNSECTISYKEHVIGRVSFKKQRGKGTDNYFGGYTYEWTFKECHADFWNEDENNSTYSGRTFKEMLDKVDELVAEDEKKEQNEFEFAKELYKLIREKCKAAKRSTWCTIDYLHKHEITLEEALKTSE